MDQSQEDMTCGEIQQLRDAVKCLESRLRLMTSIMEVTIHHAVLHHKAIGFARYIHDEVQEMKMRRSMKMPEEEWIQSLNMMSGGAAVLIELMKNKRKLSARDDVQVFCMNQLLRDFFKPELAMNDGVQLTLLLEEDRRLTVRANPWLIKEALQILTDNAVHAMKNSEIRNLVVDARATDGEFVRISMEDTGVGVPIELMNRLFKTTITDESRTGMGIGAAIAAAIIEDYGGKISIDRNRDLGAGVSLLLPHHTS